MAKKVKAVEDMSKGELLVACAKKKIKGFQGKSTDELRKMVIAHDKALNSDTSKKKKKEVEEDIGDSDEDLEDIDDDDIEDLEDDDDEDEPVPVKKKKSKKDKPNKNKSKKGDEPVAAKDLKKKVKAKKETPKKETNGGGRAKVNRKKLEADTGSPYKKNTSSDVFFKFLKKGGSKEKIVAAAIKYFDKKDIKCSNPDSRFDRIVAAINGGEAGKHTVEKSEKGKYTLA